MTDSDKALAEKTPPLPSKKILPIKKPKNRAQPSKKPSIPKSKKKPKPITKKALSTKPKPQQVSSPQKTTIHTPKPKQESEIAVPSETEKETHLLQEEKPPVKTENVAENPTEPKIQEVNSLPQTEEGKNLSESKQENTSLQEKAIITPTSKAAAELSQEEKPLTPSTEPKSQEANTVPEEKVTQKPNSEESSPQEEMPKPDNSQEETESESQQKPDKEEPPQEETSTNSEESPDNSKSKAEPPQEEEEEEEEETPTSKTEASVFRSFFDLKQRPGNPPLTYPLRARKMKAQGSVVLIFYVTPGGLVEKIQIEAFKGHRELANSVMRTLARYKFLPQQQGWVRHTVDFILDGEKVEFLRLRKK